MEIMVVPGDRLLDWDVQLPRDRGWFVRLRGPARIEGRLAAEDEFMSARAEQ